MNNNDINKLLTVLMSVHNGLPYIKEAVESILTQSYKEFDFIIINNASTDGTEDYLHTISDTRIRVYDFSEKGIAGAMNFGVEKVDTKYFAVMDADDISEPNRLNEEIEFLENHTEVGLVGAGIKYFIKRNGRSWNINLPTEHQDIIDGLLSTRYVLSFPSIMMHTELFKRIDGMRKECEYVPDYDLYLRLTGITKFANFPAVLLNCRISRKSFTSQNLKFIVTRQRKVLQEFKGNSRNDSAISLISDKLNYLSLYFYKKGLFLYLENSRVFWLFYIFISAILNPIRAFHHLIKKIR